ncbi:MAG: permease-like cell division protein FtsX [Bacillota bacterium]|nr:permease-like cell division protein FtsX [Bacillota bacterium]MDI7249827.1 permease-like cell division protein FtsX [Bacillota bacterium]
MKLRTWGYLLRETAHGIRTGRLMALASVSTVAVSLLVLGLFLALVLNLGRMMAQVESEVQIRAFLVDARQAGNGGRGGSGMWGTPGTGPSQAGQGGATRPAGPSGAQGGAATPAVPDVAKLEEQIRNLEGVTTVRFVSKQEALERMRESFGERAAILEAVDDINPLPDSFEVQVARPEQVAPVAEAIAAMPGVAKVDYKRDTVDKLFRLTAVVRGLGVVVAVLLVLGSTVVISNAIRLTVFARRREVAIMKLVGATDWFIRWPFVLEGLALGVGGAALAVGALAGAYWWAAGIAARTLPFLVLVEPEQVVRLTWAPLLGLGAVVGSLGSGISLRRFLHV